MVAISQTILSNAFFNENIPISINFSLKFVPKGPINNIPASVQIMAWRRPCDKPLSEPMMVSLLTHICVTRPQWGNKNPRTQNGILDGGSYSWNQLSRYYDAYPIYSNMYSIVLTENTMLGQNMFTSTQKWGWLRLATNLRLMNIYNQSCWQFMPKVIHYLCVLVWYVVAGFAFVHCIRNSKGSEDYGRNTYLERQKYSRQVKIKISMQVVVYKNMQNQAKTSTRLPPPHQYYPPCASWIFVSNNDPYTWLFHCWFGNQNITQCQ